MTSYEAYQKCLKQNKRIPKLEEIISIDSQCSYYYALNVIQGPFERGEEIISKHPYYSYLYASVIIEGPFEKCHPFILNSSYKNDYIYFLKTINYDITKINEWLI